VADVERYDQPETCSLTDDVAIHSIVWSADHRKSLTTTTNSHLRMPRKPLAGTGTCTRTKARKTTCIGMTSLQNLKWKYHSNYLSPHSVTCTIQRLLKGVKINFIAHTAHCIKSPDDVMPYSRTVP